jgi:putative oxidoreductase
MTASRVDTALFVLRVVVGVVFFMHGYQKVFTFGHAGMSDAFSHMGVPAPAITSFLITWLEFLGGIALIVGLLTRLAALGFIVDMGGAILIVHIKHGFFAPMGVEFPLVLLACNVAFAIAGAGRFSLDALIARRR